VNPLLAAEASGTQGATVIILVCVVVVLIVVVAVLAARARKGREAVVAAKRETIEAKTAEAHAEAVVDAVTASDADLLAGITEGLDDAR